MSQLAWSRHSASPAVTGTTGCVPGLSVAGPDTSALAGLTDSNNKPDGLHLLSAEGNCLHMTSQPEVEVTPSFNLTVLPKQD